MPMINCMPTSRGRSGAPEATGITVNCSHCSVNQRVALASGGEEGEEEGGDAEERH